MRTVPLKRLAALRVDRTRVKPAALLTLDLVESGTGSLLVRQWPDAELPPDFGVADAEPGDVLFGKLRPYLAKVLLVREPSYASTELMCLRPVHGVEPRWLQYVLLSRPLVDWAVATSEGTKMPRTSWERIGTFQVRSTGHEEQQAIADFLDAETARIDALIDKKQRLADVLKSRVSSSVEVTVQSSRSRWPCIPVKYLLHEIDERLGLRNPIELLSVSIHLGVVPRASVTDDQPRAEELSPYKVCEKHDIVINRMRAFHGGLGRAPVRGIVSPDYTVLRPTREVNSCFLNHVFRSPWFIGELTARLRGIGSADQGNVRTPRINFDDLGLILVPTPPLSVQRHLAETLDSEIRRTNSGVRALIWQIALLHERRQALVTAAVTGQLDIPGLAA